MTFENNLKQVTTRLHWYFPLADGFNNVVFRNVTDGQSD